MASKRERSEPTERFCYQQWVRISLRGSSQPAWAETAVAATVRQAPSFIRFLFSQGFRECSEVASHACRLCESGLQSKRSSTKMFVADARGDRAKTIRPNSMCCCCSFELLLPKSGPCRSTGQLQICMAVGQPERKSRSEYSKVSCGG